jgi:Spy/CpxP family protein refolding chaperone
MTRLLATIFALTLPALVAAEPPPDGKMHDRARTFLVLRLTEALDLSDEEALKVSRILREGDAGRQRLVKERREIETALRKELDGGKPDRKRLTELTDRAGKIDEQLALVPAKSFAELRKILTVEQQAKLALARPKVHHEIHRAMRRRFQEQMHEHRGQGPFEEPVPPPADAD